MNGGMKPVLAELIGTFIFFFIGAGAIVADSYSGGKVGLVGIAIAHGLILSIVVSEIGHISGGHVNPAVTFGFLVTGKMKVGTGIAYIIAQLVGGTLSGVALRLVYPESAWGPVLLGTPDLAPDVTVGTGILLEAILTFFLVWAVFSTAADPRGLFKTIGGFGIGLTICVDILAGGPLTGASMNPARTFGPALACGFRGPLAGHHIVYWIGPLLGGAIAALLYNGLFLKDAEKA